MSKRHPFLFLIGYRVYSSDRDSVKRLVDLCRNENIPYRDIEFTDDRASVVISFFYSFRLEKRARELDIPLVLISSHGIPAIAMRYRHRYGLFVGILLSLALIILSGSVIWDIRIDGERKLSEREVKAVLSECGLELGTRRRSLDIDTLENRVLILSDDIAWISVNIIGTVAEVEIRELEIAEEKEELCDASNLVAELDGRIVGFENAKGNIAVEIGESVTEGQLLIGGIYGDEESGFRYTNAQGRVLAEVERTFEVEIPRTEPKKVYTGEVKCEKYLIFFKKRIKFFANYRNLPTTCDKIEVEEYIGAPRGFELPFGIYEVRYLEYEYIEPERDDDTLFAVAHHRMNAIISEQLGDAPILRKKVSFELTDEKLILRAKIRCVQNIAKRKEIDLLLQ
ncbi:MAG: sporulation protein YqfD [Clostridia bacterium]|nr:sporulation protein YqfD [Clostridia bacterium]